MFEKTTDLRGRLPAAGGTMIKNRLNCIPTLLETTSRSEKNAFGLGQGHYYTSIDETPFLNMFWQCRVMQVAPP